MSAENQFRVDTTTINSMRFQTPQVEDVRHRMGDTQAFIPVDQDTVMDHLGTTLDTTSYALKGAEREDLSAHTIIVGPGSAIGKVDSWSEFRGHTVAIPTEEVVAALNTDKIESTYGVNLSDRPDTASLLAAAIASYAVRGATSRQAILTPQSAEATHPLLWMRWALDKQGSYQATQIAQRSAAHEGLRYQANTFLPYGPVGREVYQTLTAQWMPSSQLLAINSAMDRVPLATDNNTASVVTALATAEVARTSGGQLNRLVVAKDNEPLKFDPMDAQTAEFAIVLEMFQQHLYRQGVRLADATAADLYRLNTALREYANGTEMLHEAVPAGIIPSVNTLKRDGMINEEAIRALQNKIGKKMFQGNDRGETREGKAPHSYESGLTPSWDPEDLGGLIDSVYGELQELKAAGPDAQQRLKASILRENGSARPFYAVVQEDSLSPQFRDLMRLGVYNRAQLNGNPKDVDAINFWTDEVSTRREQILSALPQSNIRVFVPFVGEKESLTRVLNYSKERLGDPNKIIAGDAGKNARSRIIAEETGVVIADQRSNLQRIDWQKLVDDGIIPHQILNEQGVPEGLKGLNFINMMVELHDAELRGEVNDDTWIAFIDSDIMNCSDVEPTKQYDPLLYMGHVMLDDQEKGLNLRGIQIGKTGVGRNNHLTHHRFDDMMNSSNEATAKLGLAVVPYVWALTGERAYRWGALKRFLNSKDMLPETTYDLSSAQEDLHERRRGTAQILVDPPKIECANSPSDREFGMLANLAFSAKEMKTASKENGRYDWTLEDIAYYNKRFGGRPRGQTVTIDEMTAPRALQVAFGDVLIPSWDALKTGGYIREQYQQSTIIYEA